MVHQRKPTRFRCMLRNMKRSKASDPTDHFADCSSFLTCINSSVHVYIKYYKVLQHCCISDI